MARKADDQGPADLKGGVRPYALTDHIHEREASTRLASLIPSQTKPFELAFIPNVAPWFSGIISVVSAPLNKSMRAEEINKLYQEAYGQERLVTFTKTVPDVTDAEGKHGWRVGGVQVHSGGKRVVVVVSPLLVTNSLTIRVLLTTSSRVLPPSACR